jgi:hypothetical protein
VPSPAVPKPRKGARARIRDFVRRINESTPTKLVAFVVLVISAVTLSVSGYQKFFGGFSCRAQPRTYGGVGAAAPSVTRQEVNALVAAYSAAYDRHDANALGDLLTGHVCRYPANGGKPETRSAALAEYQRQFDRQAHDPAHPRPVVTYSLTRRQVVLGAGGPNEASVTGHYAVTGGKDQKDLMGDGRVSLHIVKNGDRLMIDQIVIR